MRALVHDVAPALCTWMGMHGRTHAKRALRGVHVLLALQCCLSSNISSFATSATIVAMMVIAAAVPGSWPLMTQ